MAEATVTSKGQITIPTEVRRAMGLTARDKVVFSRLLDGTTVIRAKTRSVTELKGLVKVRRSRKPVAVKDMRLGRH
jgi:AbrB family looped-hinge helix DNA binding protein